MTIGSLASREQITAIKDHFAAVKITAADFNRIEIIGDLIRHPSPTTHCFNVSNNRRVRLRVGAAVTGAGIVVLAYIALYGNAIAAPTEYAVDGLGVGTQLNFNSASYREYKCSPSDQFDGLTWCQKTRSGKERLRSYVAAYSLLHSRDGNILYINRSQEPAFFNPKEAEANIQRYSRKIGGTPRIMKMPHRGGLPDGLIAVWGKITLEPLDQQSMKILADGRGPRKGLLIDFLGNFARSAKEGLPIYHIDGGPGFIWAASFDQKEHGALRLAAVELSGFSPSSDPAPVLVQTTAQTPPSDAEPVVVQATAQTLPSDPEPVVVQATAQTPPSDPEPVIVQATAQTPPSDAEPVVVQTTAQTPPSDAEPVVVQATAQTPPSDPEPVVVQATSDPEPVVVQATAQTPPSDPEPVVVQATAQTDQGQLPSELNQTVENLQADLAISINKIAELEIAKAEAERAVKQAERAKLNAENEKQEAERARIAEKMTSDALVAQVRADKVAAGVKSSRWENALYGSVGGLIVVLTASAIGFRMNRQKASVSKQQVWELGTKPIEASPHRQKSDAELEPSALSHEIAIFETAFERELEEEVTTVNAAQDKASLRTDRSYHSIYISWALAGLLTVVSALAFQSGLLGYWEPSSGVVVLSLIFGFTIGVMWLGSEVSEIFRSARRRRIWGRCLRLPELMSRPITPIPNRKHASRHQRESSQPRS
jgi:ribosomal protein L9